MSEQRLNEEGSEKTSNIFITSNIGVGRENDSQLLSPDISQNEAIQEKEKEKNYSENNKSSGACLNIGDPLIPLLILFTRHYFSMKLKLKTILDQSA